MLSVKVIKGLPDLLPSPIRWRFIPNNLNWPEFQRRASEAANLVAEAQDRISVRNCHHGPGDMMQLSRAGVELLAKTKDELSKLGPIFELEVAPERQMSRTTGGLTVASRAIEHGWRSGPLSPAGPVLLLRRPLAWFSEWRPWGCRL